MKTIRHFAEPVDPRRPSTPALLPEALYAQALDHLVITCVDLLLTYQGKVLLGQRQTYPHPSWWLIGGRMQFGENPLATAQRKLAEEANLVAIAPHRLIYIGVYSTCFSLRQQPPQTHGLHSVNLTYGLPLTQTETTLLHLNAEYAQQQWQTIATIQAQLDPAPPMHQALLHLLQDAQALGFIEPES